MKKFLLITIVALGAMLILSACAPPAPEVVTREVEVVVTQEVEVERTVEVPVEVPAEGPTEIAVIVKTGNSSFWQNVQTGAFAAEAELQDKSPGLSVTFLGAQSESNINEQISIVESAINRGVKAIVLAPG